MLRLTDNTVVADRYGKAHLLREGDPLPEWAVGKVGDHILVDDDVLDLEPVPEPDGDPDGESGADAGDAEEAAAVPEPEPGHAKARSPRRGKSAE